jgi:tripartite ATP-independent transporter DctP family solute receptor
MKENSKLLVSLTILVGVFLVCLNVEAAEHKWKMPSIFADPSSVKQFNSTGKAQKMFADLVGKRSGGRIKIRPYYMSVLGGEREILEGLKRGDIETALVNPLGGADKRFDTWAIPYLAKTYEEIDAILCEPNSPLFSVVSRWLDEHGIKLLGIGEGGFRSCINKVRPIQKVDDLKGLKIRVYQSPICFAFWKAVSVATPMSWQEVYSALTMGTIDGLECPAWAMFSFKFYEGAKYISLINWQWSSQMIVMNKKIYNELPDDLKKIVRDTAVEVARIERQGIRKDENNVLSKLQEMGCKVNELSPQALEDFSTVAERLAPEFKKVVGAEAYKEVKDAIKSLRK